jgi:hypothetical protein
MNFKLKFTSDFISTGGHFEPIVDYIGRCFQQLAAL